MAQRARAPGSNLAATRWVAERVAIADCPGFSDDSAYAAMDFLLDEIVIVLAVTVVSGGAIGTQVSAAIAYVVGVLAVVQIVLVSYLAMPAKTHAVRLLHDWASAHRRQVLLAMFAVGGVSLVAHGMGSV